MPRKYVPKPKLIPYAGFDPTERNAPNTHKKPGRATKERLEAKPKRKLNGAYERRIKDEAAHTKPA